MTLAILIFMILSLVIGIEIGWQMRDNQRMG